MRRIRSDYAQAQCLTWCPECGNTRVVKRKAGEDACMSCAIAAEADWLARRQRKERRAA